MVGARLSRRVCGFLGSSVVVGAEVRRSAERGAYSVPACGDGGGPAPGFVDAQAGLSGAAGDAGGHVQDTVAECLDLAAGQSGFIGEADQFGPGDQIGCSQDDFKPRGVRLKSVEGQVTQAGGFAPGGCGLPRPGCGARLQGGSGGRLMEHHQRFWRHSPNIPVVR